MDEDTIKRLRPTVSGKRYDKHDGEVANLVVRVGTLTKVFVLMARFPGDVRTTRRKIGTVGLMSLDKARAIARDWNEKIKQGIDPEEEKTRSEREKRLQERRVFRSALVDFIAWLPDRRYTRHVTDDIAVIRRTLLENPEAAEILTKAVADVTRDDLGEIVDGVNCRSMSQAYQLCDQLQAFFRWVRAPGRSGPYGIVVNPIDGLTAGDFDVWKNARLHVLEPWELRAYWQAAGEIPYPYGPYFKVLLLIAERRTAVAEMRWSELDPGRRVWRAPPIKVKGKLVEHLVPLSDQLMELLADLRHSQPPGHGDYVFSSSYGQRSINGFGGATKTLRARAEAALREIDPTKVMRHFVLHDDRRVDRTALSALDVANDVAEGILNHSKKGMEGLYDQYRQIPQRRKAMARLHDRLDEVVAGSKDDFWEDEPSGGSWEDFGRAAAGKEAERTTRGRQR
ncbi:tyrosine-type recombinase/integrase [Rhizobium leguminosarum]|uniref:tyrosine-type recombinase/integrase n=1 Tax=Rhizobium leguminosarum TaxID=384 RepID=UPI0013EE88A5|nr:integrase arm-type DNA-binding domain-containing protein [Rhizobium leguminosarum]